MSHRSHFLQPLLKTTGGDLALYVDGRDVILASVLEGAFDSKSRNRGLLGRSALPTDSALVIAPCSAVHTIGMRFPIDVIFASRDGRVIKIRHAMPARRMAMSFGAFAVIEMAAGAAARAGLQPNERLVVRRRQTVDDDPSDQPQPPAGLA
jgi:uncharacterized membrane protein (UPF0127 family)